jgi:hypothetical protein
MPLDGRSDIYWNIRSVVGVRIISRSTILGRFRPCSAGGEFAFRLHNPDLAHRLIAS